MTKILWAANVLRDAGVEVYEMPGWKDSETRPGFDVNGIVCHHTATGPNWQDGHVALLLRRGRSDLSGPLSQFGLERDGTWVCIAAGRCNHNGYGVWGNDSIGIEAYNNGKGEVWPDAQMESYGVGVAALCEKTGLSIAEVRGHKETDPTRKIDPTFNMDNFRVQVNKIMVPIPIPIPSPTAKGDDVFLVTQKKTGNMWLMEEGRRALVPSGEETLAKNSDIPYLGEVSDPFFGRLGADRKVYQEG